MPFHFVELDKVSYNLNWNVHLHVKEHCTQIVVKKFGIRLEEVKNMSGLWLHYGCGNYRCKSCRRYGDSDSQLLKCRGLIFNK